MKLLRQEFDGYAQYGLSDIIKIILECQNISGILFRKYFEENPLV